MVNDQDAVSFSIIIPAKNEANNIGNCLNAIFQQEIDKTIEVLVLDSGSTDNTIEIIRQFPKVKLIHIPAKEFGHGRTRNFGAKNAGGEFLIFLNADAIPANNQWLKSLYEGFRHDEKIAGVFSRHLPKSGCYLYMVRDLLNSTPPSPTLMIREKLHSFDFMVFSTVSCIIRKKIWQQFPFKDDISIAEDQEWAGRILEHGFKLAYQPQSLVFHSHNYSPEELYKIKENVAKSTSRFKSKPVARLWGGCLSLGGFFIKCWGDVRFILFKNPTNNSFKNNINEIKIALKARSASFRGKFAGWIEADYNNQR